MLRRTECLHYENLSKNGYPIYRHIVNLLKANPFLKYDKNVTIFFINGCSGFGSQITLFVQNCIAVNDYNPHIVCLPYFCQNNCNFKYHEESYYNSFFLYFRYLKEVNKNNKVFFTYNHQLTQKNFIIYSTPMNIHPINRKYIQYMRDHFQIRIGENIRKFINSIRIPNKKLVGIHVRSVAQKIAHKNEYGKTPKPVEIQLQDLKNVLDTKHGTYQIFVATDVDLYIDYCKKIFPNNVYFIENITRVNSEVDSIPYLDKQRGFKLGSDILYDCIGLSMCDELFVNYSNIPYLVDIIKDENHSIEINEY